MSIRVDGNVVSLVGKCGLEDAEALLGILQSGSGFTVDLTNASHLHAAVLQLLMAFTPPLAGAAEDAFILNWLIPPLGRSAANRQV